MFRSHSVWDYINLIQRLSETDAPKFFGLPENVNRSWQLSRSVDIIEQLKTVHQEPDVKRSDWKTQLTPILNLWKKINQSNTLIQTKLNKDVHSFDSPLSAFLHQEFVFSITLVQHIHNCLAGISKVIRGSSAGDNEINKAANDIMNQQTPDAWQSLWTGSQNPLLYIRSVVTRGVTVHASYQRSDSFWKSPVDLSGLFHPEAFLSVLKQHTARHYKIPLDELFARTDWFAKDSRSSNQISVIIEGLLIEGAQFQREKLVELTKDSPICTSAPPLTFAYVPKDNALLGDTQKLQVPLYTSASRDVIITEIDIPIWGDQDRIKWLQSGTALYVRL
ncbi:hypothetical protein WDU94_008035 [Cyamophila willieti]